jgi:streptogramin lyase
VGEDPLPGISNYLIGNDSRRWHTNVGNYGKVVDRGVYPGIDLVYYGNQQELEYDFVVSAGADPGAIRMSFQGAESLSLDAAGNLVLHAAGGDVVEHAPVLYQGDAEGRQAVGGRFVLGAGGQVGFQVDSYDPSRALTIDPVLNYSTYLGGSGIEQGSGIAVDGAGNAYVTGYTTSANFPTTAGAFQTAIHGGQDAFVAKLNPSGTALVYSTYVGGSGTDGAHGVAVDGAGSAYIIGYTNSSNFPTTSSAFQTTNRGTFEAFVSKLNPTGAGLAYSTYLGGKGADEGFAIAVDGTGIAYVTGTTHSTDFPTTPGAFQTTLGNSIYGNGFVTKLNASGSALVYSTYLGGSGGDGGFAIAADNGGSAYVTGATNSFNFPTTSGAFQTSNHGGQDAFVTKFNVFGGLAYSTYLGGSGNDRANGIAIDSAGYAYVTGVTDSHDFLTSPGAYQTSNRGATNLIVVKLNPAGTALAYSTYLGGSGYDAGYSIALDGAGNASVTGYTTSSDFPTTAGAVQRNHGSGNLNAFVSKLNTAGTALVYSTFLGGSGIDGGQGIAVDAAGSLYVTGYTSSANFPTTAGAFQTTNHGSSNAFIAKITIPGPATHFAVSAPVSTTAGTAFSTTVTALDANNNVADGYTGTVHFSSTDAQAGLPGNYTFIASDNGSHTFSVTLKTAGNRAVTATDALNGSITGSASVMVNPAAAYRLGVANPAGATAGTAFAVTVTAYDPYNNVAPSYTGTVHFSSADPQAVLPPDAQLTNGIGSFNVTLKTAGTQGIQAADTGNAVLSGVAATFTEFPVPTASSQPRWITTGPDGNVWFAEYTGQKIGRISPTGTFTEFLIPGMGYSQAEAITTGSDGNLWFTESVRSQIWRLTASGTFTAFSVPTPDSLPVGITAGPDGSLWFTEYRANKIGKITTTGAFTEYPVPTAAAGPQYITAGADGNLWFTEWVADKIGKITPAGAFSEYPVATSTANLDVIAPGPDGNLWFTEGYGGNKIGKITPGGAITEFALPAPGSTPFGITAGADGNLWFTEVNGNTIGRVTPGGAFSELALPTGNSGPLGITMGPDGNLWFTETYGNKVGRLTPGVVVQPAAASVLSVIGFPSLVRAGDAGTFTVTAKDAYGNIATGYTGTVHFTSSDGRASLPADSALTNGTGTFSATLKTAGTQSITATDTVNNSITGTQAGITVTPAAASTLVVTTDAANPDVAGTFFDVTVTAVDPYGNTDSNYLGTIHFSSADPYPATLPADYTFQTSDTGSVTVIGQTALYTAGSWDVTATDTANGGITGATVVQVQAAPAIAFQILAPASVVSGTAFDITVMAVDPYGNTDTNYTGTVTFSTSDGDPAVMLPPDYRFQSSDQGMVTFTGMTTLITLGDQSLMVTDTESGITGAAVVTVTSGPLASGHEKRSDSTPTTPQQTSALAALVASCDVLGSTSSAESTRSAPLPLADWLDSLDVGLLDLYWESPSFDLDVLPACVYPCAVQSIPRACHG